MVPCSSCGQPLDSVASQCGRCGAPVRTRVDTPGLAHAATALGSSPLPPFGTGPLPPPVSETTPPLASLPPAVTVAGVEPLPPPSSGLLAPGHLFDGKYRVERQLGSGGMSVVYLATEVTVDSQMVIKALLPHLSSQPAVRERLLREARALARIDHPNVVDLKTVVTRGPELFLVMEYVPGRDLARHIDEWGTGKRPALDRLLSMFFAVLDGVEAAHQEGIIHRDIKPSNVLVRDRDGRVKVTDFGIAKSASDGDHQLTSGMIGTLFYMAPEQLQADPSIDARADIYALGILLYELLTGAVPFHAASSYEVARQHIQVPFPSLRSKAHDLALEDALVARLDVVLSRACAKERSLRYPSCDELRQALLQATAGLVSVSSPPRIAGSLPPRAAAAERPPTALSPAERGATEVLAPPASFVPPLAEARPTEAKTGGKAGLVLSLLSAAMLGVVALWWFIRPSSSPPRTSATAVAPATAKAPATAAVTPAATPAAKPTATTTACAQASDCKAPANAVPVCYQGACSYSCPLGFYDCGAGCFDLNSDVKHCGACGGVGTDCTTMRPSAGATPRCEQGRCALACPAGLESCGKGCCAAGQVCKAGACVAP